MYFYIHRLNFLLYTCRNKSIDNERKSLVYAADDENPNRIAIKDSFSDGELKSISFSELREVMETFCNSLEYTHHVPVTSKGK